MAEGILDLTALLMGGVTGESEVGSGYAPLSYPLELPSVGGILSLDWGADMVRGVSESPFTYHRHVYRHAGERWRVTVALPSMTSEIANQWNSFLLALDGGFGSFRFYDVFNPEPKGLAFGDPVVDGAGQSGKTLSVRGFNPNVNSILLAGDKLQLGNCLHQVLRDANSDELGRVTLDIFPRMRFVPEDGLTIVTSKPKGLFRMAAPNIGLVISDIRGIGQVYAFQILEAF